MAGDLLLYIYMFEIKQKKQQTEDKVKKKSSCHKSQM